MLVRKLKSNRGMSIIMGLLVLLVCVTAGAAALTSAASNAGRYTHMRQDQQRYLAVASAARTVRDELCAGEYTASASLTKTYRHYTTTSEDGEVSWHTAGPYYALNTPAGSSYAGEFGPWLEERLEDLFQAQEVPSNWWGLVGHSQHTVHTDGEYKSLSVAVDGDDQVKWELKMGEDYSLYARFWLEETDKNGKVSTYYVTTLTIPANTVESETMSSGSGGSETWTVTTRDLKVTWPLAGAVIRQSY